MKKIIIMLILASLLMGCKITPQVDVACEDPVLELNVDTEGVEL